MITIIADDLTSALDGAAPFAARGLPARVVMDNLASQSRMVLALDLDSRNVSAAKAAALHEVAVRCCGSARIIFKTVDSTLRGNLAAEITGTLAGSSRSHAIVAPAFPGAGRTTIDGRQFVHGVALDLTEFGNGPQTPAMSSLIADRVRELPVGSYTIIDAVNDGDLDAIVARLTIDADVLWVGSPGLAAALARAMPAEAAGPVRPLPACGRVLVVVGSMHQANVAQIENLGSAGVVNIRMRSTEDAEVARCVTGVAAGFARGTTVCLVAPAWDGHQDPVEIARAIGRIVAQSSGQFDGLVATGGDTLRRIVDALEVEALDLAGEVDAGIPFGELRAGGRAWPFVSKAGGFGDPRTLSRCAARLRVPAGFLA